MHVYIHVHTHENRYELERGRGREMKKRGISTVIAFETTACVRAQTKKINEKKIERKRESKRN